jgi:ABC-type antimicrobial peptide transport system permease subunit
MSLFSLIRSNLKFYRKSYLAILAGTVISTAVLTGALVVGDSVRFSLGHLTDIRLGKTQFAIQSGDRFFRQQLADELSEKTKSYVAPLLQLEGIAINSEKDTRINRVEVIGIDDRFINFWDASISQPAEDEAILSQTVAEKLNLKTGDEFLLKLHKQSKASENAPFVSEEEPMVTFRLKVSTVADDQQMGRFSLKTNQSAPFNIFISLKTMARKVDLTGSANVLLIAENKDEKQYAKNLDSLIRLCWQPEDAGLEFRKLPETNSLEIRSGRIFIEDNTSKAILKTIPEAKPVFTYLVNSISSKLHSTPYSFVTATENYGWQLSEKEIIINNWLADDLKVKVGDSLQLRYFKMGALRKLTEDSSRFCIKAILPITNPIFDRTLMPDFPGMSDAGNCRDWETGAPVDLGKIRDKDEQYWNDYRGTPKAFISLESGKKLWDNAFGNTTAFRFSADSSTLPVLKAKLMSQLVPSENGLKVQDVYTQGKLAAANSTDFGGLFLSLSFFIIVAALMLTALLFSLHAQTRMSETAILSTLGFRKNNIFRILMLETAIVVILGSLLGTFLGVFYNKLLLVGLNTLWQDAVRTSMLQMHILPLTLFIGFAAGSTTALVSLFFVLARNLRKPLSALVKGYEIAPAYASSKREKTGIIITLLFLAIAAALIISAFTSTQADLSTNFLSAGGMFLAAGIAALYSLLQHVAQKSEIAVPGFFRTVIKNIGFRKTRTIFAIALLAIGTFSVIITGANRKTFYGMENMPQSGTGGFLLWVETTIPILNDLNSSEGKEKYGISDEIALKDVKFVQMLSLDGNDASCLNLNQVSQPKILGVFPQVFDAFHSFSFADLDEAVNKEHPWLALNQQLAPGIIPAYADQTVITWGLQKKIGDTLLYTDESGKQLNVKLMGGLGNSVFQGNILVSAELFRQYFPSVGGSKTMLVSGDFIHQAEISQRLEYLFQDYGMVVTPASAKLAQFNSVENTYLTVFMMLGGLGIIIGTIGLGIVLLRNLNERKREIALYQAIGFKRNYIFKLIFTENLFILFAGIEIGTLSALAGILPSFFSPTFQLPSTFLLFIILIILLNGLVWIYFPVKSALRKNLVEALRKE